jgi:hypothetical protein
LLSTARLWSHKIVKLSEVPTYSMVPPGTTNYPGGARAVQGHAVSRARRAGANAMRAAGYGPEKPLHLRFATTTSKYQADDRADAGNAA